MVLRREARLFVFIIFAISCSLVLGFKPISKGSYRTFIRSKPEKDFIDIEVADDSNTNRQSSKLVKDTGNGNGLFNLVKKTGKGVLGMFKKDEVEEEKKKKALAVSSEFDKGIDQLFAGSGLMGGIAKGLVKTVGKSIMKSFEESRGDVDMIQSIVRRSIEAEGILGEGVECSPPMSQSYSSQSINGVSTKNVYLSFSVQGDKGMGAAEVQASIDSNNIATIQTLNVRTNQGAFNVKSRGPGGYSGGSGSGTVIDVEEIT